MTLPQETSSKRWLVIGGGMAGMTLAQSLAIRDQQVTLAEAASSLGGLTSAWSLGDVVWDRFYHVTLLSDTRLRQLLQDLNLESQIRWVTTRTGFYTDEKLYSLSSAWEFLKFPPLNLIQKLRLGATIFYTSKLRDWRRLEGIPVDEFLIRCSGRSTFEKIWLPLLKAKLGESYKQTSAAFIWAYISRMYKARRSGMKTEMFGYVPGGYARILREFEAWLRKRNVHIHTQRPVAGISRQLDGRLKVTYQDGSNESFDRVISTIASPLISQQCPELTSDEHLRHQNIEYLGIVCASMLTNQPLSPYYVTNITDTSVPMTAVIEMSTIVDQQELAGHSLIYLPKYLSAEDPRFGDSDDAIKERFLATLERMHPQFSREDVIAFQIARAKYVMALPTMYYSQQLPPVCTSVPGFYALNGAHITKGNLNVNESLELIDEKLDAEVWPAHIKLQSVGS